MRVISVHINKIVDRIIGVTAFFSKFVFTVDRHILTSVIIDQLIGGFYAIEA